MRSLGPLFAPSFAIRAGVLITAAGALAGCAADNQRLSAPWSTAQQQYNQTYGRQSPRPAPAYSQAPQPGDVTGSIPQRQQPTVSSQALPPIGQSAPPPQWQQPSPQPQWTPPPAPQAQWTPQPAPPAQWSPQTPRQEVRAVPRNSLAPWTPAAAPPREQTASFTPPPAPPVQPPRPIAAAPQPSVPYAPGQTVVVGEGDTFARIARRANVSAKSLMAANNIRNADQIYIGQRLVVPGPAAPALADPAPRFAAAPPRALPGQHVVQQGESIASIARQHNVQPADLARANNFGPSDRLVLGQTLILPRAGAPRDHLAQPAISAAAADPRPTGSIPPVAEAPRAPAPRFSPAPSADEDNDAPAPAETASTQSAAPPRSNTTEFRWPAKGRVIANFGRQAAGGQNDGINIAVPAGTPVKAAENGVVAYAGSELKGYGNLVLIRHEGDWVTAYAHNSEVLVKKGETVKRGQIIGRAGQSGSVTQPQLHFEIRKGATPVDPMTHLSGG